LGGFGLPHLLDLVKHAGDGAAKLLHRRRLFFSKPASNYLP
jgi:hypothetical protein